MENERCAVIVEEMLNTLITEFSPEERGVIIRTLTSKLDDYFKVRIKDAEMMIEELRTEYEMYSRSFHGDAEKTLKSNLIN